MNKQDYYEIGLIVKTHGIHGELILQSKNPELIENTKESLILEIDGLLVPFFIDEISFTSQARFRIKFDWINNEQQARKLVKCAVFAHQNNIDLNTSSLMEDNLDLLQGFMIVDQKFGELGIINFITPDNINPLISVTYKKQELLIPLHPDLIIDINQEIKTIEINCPEGLIDLFFK